MPHSRAVMTCCLSNCSAPIYFYRKTLTFSVETGKQLDRRDTRGVCADTLNKYGCLQKAQAVCIDTNGAVFVNGKPTTNQLLSVTAGQGGQQSCLIWHWNCDFRTTDSNEDRNFNLGITISLSNGEVVVDLLPYEPQGSLDFWMLGFLSWMESISVLDFWMAGLGFGVLAQLFSSQFSCNW